MLKVFKRIAVALVVAGVAVGLVAPTASAALAPASPAPGAPRASWSARRGRRCGR